jgi:lysophospholipase L1-like esterase
VACIGNSSTDGFGIEMATQIGYPAQLQKLLGNDYYVKNFGVSGRTWLNKGDLPYQKEKAWRDALAFNADIIIIKLGTNDSKPENWQFNKGFKEDLQQMTDLLRACGRQHGKTNQRIYLCTPIKAFRDKWGITDSVIVNGVIPTIRRVAERNGLPVIDLHPVVDDASLMTSDMIHPNDRGARRIAETIKEKIGGER